MKRQKLLKHLRSRGCHVLREGGRHTIVKNSENDRQTAVPRHPEIQPDLVRRICKQLGIDPPSER